MKYSIYINIAFVYTVKNQIFLYRQNTIITFKWYQFIKHNSYFREGLQLLYCIKNIVYFVFCYI